MPDSRTSVLSSWAAARVEAGGWIRRMFSEGQRLKAEHGAAAVADLSLGQPLEPPEAVREALKAAAAERQPGRFGYMPNLGYPAVRERAAADVGSPGVTTQGIAMTVGAAGAISLALRTFVEPGDEVLGVAPYFSEFPLYCETAGMRFVPVPTRDDLEVDLGALERALSERSGALIINTPSNPSGHVMGLPELEGIARVLLEHRRRHGRPLLLIADEVYRRVVYPPAHHADVFSVYEHTVLARSFSKDLGLAGERIGYLALHPSLAGEDTERGLEVSMRALGYVSAPATPQRALAHLDSWHVDNPEHGRLRDAAAGGAANAGLDAADPQGALYLWVRCPWADTIAFVQALAERRVLVTPGVAFGVPTHVRLCFTAGTQALAMAFTAMAELAGRGGFEPPKEL